MTCKQISLDSGQVQLERSLINYYINFARGSVVTFVFAFIHVIQGLILLMQGGPSLQQSLCFINRNWLLSNGHVFYAIVNFYASR
jgi:hypothetical protein